MTKNQLQKLFEQEQCRELAWEGKCHDCGKEVTVVATVENDGQLTISGGAVYKPWEADDTFYIKCSACFEKDSVLREYQPTEIYQRVVGYYRPVQQYNSGKKAEFEQRVSFEPVS